MANLKIVTGRLAIGPPGEFQNWLDRAVRTANAVSPKYGPQPVAPGDHPARADFSVMVRITFHLGVPSA